MSTLIIAEVGVNHNGDLRMAKDLIAAAKFAGADIVKLQSFKANKLVTRSADKAKYQKVTTSSKETQYQMLRGLELSHREHEVIFEECHRLDIGFFSTAFDAESFDFLVELGLKKVKIPSGELTNFPLLRYVTRLGMPVILSTGMATLGEVEAAISEIEGAGTPRNKITLLHCTTEYPTPMLEVNLRAMVNMKLALGIEVGYSDHTLGIEIPIAAVALGASVIEKHLTLDRTLPGPDHSSSLEPEELKKMVDAIRNVEKALGDGVKRPSQSELINIPNARKSLVASRAIEAGERYTVDNISTKRPGTGISPMRWDEVIGRFAPRDFSMDELIEL